MAQTSERHIPALTGLRFFLAMHVVGFHLLYPYLTWVPGLAQAVLQRGYLAVSTFFVLSGFVLTYSYLGRQGGVAVDQSKFWAARFARIYPVYALSLLVSAPLFFVSTYDNPGEVAASLFTVPAMVQSWWPATSEQWNGPAWSLSTEAFFYLLFPFIAPRLVRLSTAWILTLLTLSWVASWSLPYMLLRLGLMEHTMHNPVVRTPEFLIGVLLGCLYLRRPKRSSLPSATWPTLAALAVAAAVAGYVLSSRIQLSVFGPGLFVPMSALLVYALASSSRGLASVLALGPFVFLGEASYALYLLHMPLRLLIDQALQRLPFLLPLASTRGFFALLLVVMIGASVLALVFVERPARRAIRRRLGGTVSAAQRPRVPARSTAASV